MKCRLGSGRISPPAGFEPGTLWSKVGSANRSATRTLHKWYNGLPIFTWVLVEEIKKIAQINVFRKTTEKKALYCSSFWGLLMFSVNKGQSIHNFQAGHWEYFCQNWEKSHLKFNWEWGSILDPLRAPKKIPCRWIAQEIQRLSSCALGWLLMIWSKHAFLSKVYTTWASSQENQADLCLCCSHMVTRVGVYETLCPQHMLASNDNLETRCQSQKRGIIQSNIYRNLLKS